MKEYSKVCIKCGKVFISAGPARKTCDECRPEWLKEQTAVMYAQNVARYHARRDKRQCVKCGAPLPDGWKTVHCEPCRISANAAANDWYRCKMWRLLNGMD